MNFGYAYLMTRRQTFVYISLLAPASELNKLHFLLNSFPNNEISGLSKSLAFADDNVNGTQQSTFEVCIGKTIKNIVVKGENVLH